VKKPSTGFKASDDSNQAHFTLRCRFAKTPHPDRLDFPRFLFVIDLGQAALGWTRERIFSFSPFFRCPNAMANMTIRAVKGSLKVKQ